VCPVPYDYYRVLGVALQIRVTTLADGASAFRLQAVKPSTGAVSTAPFTCDTASIGINAVGNYIVRMWSARVAKLSAAGASGFTKIVPTTTGAAFTSSGAAAITDGPYVISSKTDSLLGTSSNEWLPEIVQVSARGLQVMQLCANFLIQPVAKV